MNINVQKMREALEKILEQFYEWCDGKHYAQLNESAYQRIKTALSAPQRNCDLYATRKEAWLAWENHCEETGTYEDVDEIDLYNEWLFS